MQTPEILAKRRARYAELMKDPIYAEKIKSKLKIYRAKNSALLKQIDREWRCKNRERCRKNAKLWRIRNWKKDNESHNASYFRHREKRNAAHKKYNELHRVRLREVERQRRQQNIEWERERLRIYYQKNKIHYRARWIARNALQKQATVNLRSILDFIKSVKSKRFVRCYYCDRQIRSEDCHFDHIVALSKGGPHSVDNLCVSCVGCNLAKHNKSIRAWVKCGQQILEL